MIQSLHPIGIKNVSHCRRTLNGRSAFEPLGWWTHQDLRSHSKLKSEKTNCSAVCERLGCRSPKQRLPACTKATRRPTRTRRTSLQTQRAMVDLLVFCSRQPTWDERRSPGGGAGPACGAAAGGRVARSVWSGRGVLGTVWTLWTLWAPHHGGHTHSPPSSVAT